MSKFQLLRTNGVVMGAFLEILEEYYDIINYLFNEDAVCKTALATPGHKNKDLITYNFC